MLTGKNVTLLPRSRAVKTADQARVTGPMLIAAAAPVCLATLAVCVFVGFELSGRTLSSEGPMRNIAEAAAVGSISEVVRFLDAGENPNAIVEVRPFAISSSIRRVTGVEAAVWYRSAQLMQLLDRRGAMADQDVRRRVTCLAVDLHADEIVSYLAPDGASSCVPGQAIGEVEARQ